MKKLNNQGFAISTLLYGLMIMSLLIVLALLGNLSTSRQNTVNYVDLIEDELNRLSVSDSSGYYQGGAVDSNGREYIAPDGAWYKIEIWGAGTNTQRGDYASAIMYLQANDFIYFYLGSQDGSFNGGATDVRLYSSDVNDSDSLASRFMVALGGKGSGKYYGMTTSFIYGNAGSRFANKSGTLTNQPSGTYEDLFRGDYDSSGNPRIEDYTPKIYNGMIIEDVHSGNGQFKVTKVSSNDENNPPRKGSNASLNQVQYIRDCVSGSATWSEIQAIDEGRNVALNRSVSGSGISNSSKMVDGDTTTKATASGSGSHCVTINLGGRYDLEEVAVWHSANATLTGHNISVSSDNSNWRKLGSISGKFKDPASGLHFSSFQYDTTQNLPDGNYYIFVDSNHVLGLKNESNQFMVGELFDGSDEQLWHVYQSSGKYYIESVVNQRVLQAEGSNLYFRDKSSSGTQLFTIASLGNGYYRMNNSSNTRIALQNNSVNGMLVSNNATGYNQFRFVLASY